MARPQAEYHLYGVQSWGSVLVEAAMVLARVPYKFEDKAGFDKPGPARDRLITVTALAQVPVLVLPDNVTMTESAAILLYLSELIPRLALRRKSEARCGLPSSAGSSGS